MCQIVTVFKMSSTKNIDELYCKYIDLTYLLNYIKNSHETNTNNYEIFNQDSNDRINILYLINQIKLDHNYSQKIMIKTLFYYTKFCEKYANFIENYTYLFAIIYLVIDKYYSLEKHLSSEYIGQILKLDSKIINQMLLVITKFVHDIAHIYNGYEKTKIIKFILSL